VCIYIWTQFIFLHCDLASYLNKIGDKDDSVTSDLVIVHPAFNFDNLCDASVVRHFACLISMSAQLLPPSIETESGLYCSVR